MSWRQRAPQPPKAPGVGSLAGLLHVGSPTLEQMYGASQCADIGAPWTRARPFSYMYNNTPITTPDSEATMFVAYKKDTNLSIQDVVRDVAFKYEHDQGRYLSNLEYEYFDTELPDEMSFFFKRGSYDDGSTMNWYSWWVEDMQGRSIIENNADISVNDSSNIDGILKMYDEIFSQFLTPPSKEPSNLTQTESVLTPDGEISIWGRFKTMFL